MTLAIVGGTVIDGTGKQPVGNGTILVENGVIVADAATPRPEVPDHAQIIDARGKYVIPGLLDANVHLCQVLPELLIEYEGRYAELIEEAAQVTLKYGVTTVFDTWGPREALVDVRDRVNRGDVVGSRIFLAGNIIGLGGPLSSDFRTAVDSFGPDTVKRINHHWEQGVGSDLSWLTPEDVRRRVRAYVEQSDIDFVKYAGSGHSAAEMRMIAFSPAAQRAIVEEAHRAGMTVQAHTTSVESLRMEIEAGADLLQHGDVTGPAPIPDELVKTIVDHDLPIAALLGTAGFHAWVDENGSDVVRNLIHNEAKRSNDRRLVEAGAKLLLTTDALVFGPRVLNHPKLSHWKHAVDSPIVLGESHFRWLEAAVECGLSPMEALRSATRNVAEAYGRADLGTLEIGKRADLLILDADPLDDVRNCRRIAEVVKDGMLVDRDALPARPRLLGGHDGGEAR